MYNFTVNKIAWSGLYIPIEGFNNFKEALNFTKRYKKFSFMIYDNFKCKKVYESEAV